MGANHMKRIIPFLLFLPSLLFGQGHNTKSRFYVDTQDSSIDAIRAITPFTGKPYGFTGLSTGAVTLTVNETPNNAGFTLALNGVNPWFHINDHGLGMVGNNISVPYISSESSPSQEIGMKIYATPGSSNQAIVSSYSNTGLHPSFILLAGGSGTDNIYMYSKLLNVGYGASETALINGRNTLLNANLFSLENSRGQNHFLADSAGQVTITVDSTQSLPLTLYRPISTAYSVSNFTFSLNNAAYIKTAYGSIAMANPATTVGAEKGRFIFYTKTSGSLTAKMILDEDGNMTVGATIGTGAGDFYAKNITSSGTMHSTGLATFDTTVTGSVKLRGSITFSGTNARAATYVPGTLSTDYVVVTPVSADGTTAPLAQDFCKVIAKTDSIVVIRAATGGTSGMVVNYIRMK
jgi:hypothetical protein